MPTAIQRRTAGCVVLAVLVLVSSTRSNRADVIILKDGYTLIGKIKRENDTVLDPGTGKPVAMPKSFFMIDDEVRRVVFSIRQLAEADEKNVNKNPDLIVLTRAHTPLITAKKMEPFGAIEEVTPFDRNWDRNYRVAIPLKGSQLTRQRMTVLTPYYARVESSRYIWYQMYSTRELGPDVVKQLLYNHPDLTEKGGQVEPKKRMTIVRFLTQAGMYDAAEQELDQFLKDAPNEKQRIDDAREAVRAAAAQQFLDEIEIAHKAGREGAAQKLLAGFPKAADDKQQAEARKLRARYDTATEAMKSARRFLKDLPPRVSPEAHKAIYAEAAAAILAELNSDNHQRLEAFIKQAGQEERDRQQSRPATETPGQLMALAVSGWLLGNNGAENKQESGIRLWGARQFVLDYCRTASQPARQKLLASYQAGQPVAFDELALMIATLPPLEPEEKLSNNPMPLEVSPANARRKGTNYVVQLPPEYHHGRSYPVLVVLHQGVEKAADSLDRWTELAGQHGYILMAPDWGGGKLGKTYGYSPEEHAIVLDSLRDLQRRFNVDCNRVFLTGLGEGGSMAYDIGLSHPDLFAGVSVMGAQPKFFGQAYWTNAHSLPFYVVGGDLAGESTKGIRKQFESWIGRGYPCLWVEYKGRGMEWFWSELPMLFDWMDRKKRSNAFPDLGECSSMRTTDNRFYWITTDGLSDKAQNDVTRWNFNTLPGTVHGRIVGDQIGIHVKGFKQVTIWLGPGMIDFTKKVTVLINTQTRLTNKEIKENVGVMLEDFAQRGDRQRLFYYRIDLVP